MNSNCGAGLVQMLSKLPLRLTKCVYNVCNKSVRLLKEAQKHTESSQNAEMLKPTEQAVKLFVTYLLFNSQKVDLLSLEDL